MENEVAAGIAKQSSPAAVDTAWAKVSAHCPGYKPPLPEQPASTIGYPSVDAALADLHSKAGVKFTNQNGWTLAEDVAADTLWSFPPPGHPAYPSAVKRQLIKQGSGVSMEMTVHCDAAKNACDDLVRSFQQLNAEMAASMRDHR
jgi:hypothetical protein